MEENKFEGKIDEIIEKGKRITASQKYIFDKYYFFINGSAYFIHDGNYCLINDHNCIYLLKLYEKYKLNFYEYIAGDYEIGVWDIQKKKWVIVQGEIAASNTLYYFVEEKSFLFDIMLRRLLLKINMTRKLNLSVVDEFISKGYVVGKDTLIQGGYKLPPSHILVYDMKNKKLCMIRKKRGIYKFHYSIFNSKICVDKYEENIKNLELRIKNKPWALCLSSGYDSNYLLYYLRKHLMGNLMTLTAGGENGENEIDNVNKILSVYKDIDSHEYIIDKSIIENLPDMVWQLEASVYDKGIFGDYILAEKAKSLKLNTVIMGEGHDEIRNLKQTKDFLIYNILKKSSILFRNKGIQIIRPYLDKNIVKIVCKGSGKTKKEKTTFKRYVQSLMPDDIAVLLTKQGGSIDLETIFEDDNALEKYSSLVVNSKIFPQSSLDYLYQSINDKKQVVLGCIYVIVFVKLYISGTFDSQFLRRSIDTDLESLFYK